MTPPPGWTCPAGAIEHHVTEDSLIRIGLAHGAAYGFNMNEEQRANPIEPTRPDLARLDYLSLHYFQIRAFRPGF